MVVAGNGWVAEGCWGLLEWLLIVSQWIIPENSLLSTSKLHTDWWFGTIDFYDFPFSWECHHPNWRSHIFQDVKTTNQITIPICSMYGIFTNIYPINGPNVGKYTIHGAYGIYGYLCSIHKLIDKLTFICDIYIYITIWYYSTHGP